MWVEDELRVTTEDAGGVRLVRLTGVLTRRSAGTAHTALRKALLDHGRMVVDVSGLRLRSPAQLAMFPAVLVAAGGWPIARVVLYASGGEVLDGMRRTGRVREVRVADGLAEALTLLDLRPERVRRVAELPPTSQAPALARVLVELAADD